MNGMHMVLSCDGCVMLASDHCSDCLVTALSGPAQAVLDPPTARAVAALQDVRLLPPLRRAVAG